MHRPEILLHDTEMVAINKPPGLLVHRSRIDAHASASAMQQLRAAMGCGVRPVHRLDKGTSGVLLVALEPGRPWRSCCRIRGRARAST
jgi:tRNA pseudouridine65 synthase